MNSRTVRIWPLLWRGAILLLTLQIVATSTLRYVTGGEAPPPPIVANAYADPFLAVHAISGTVALFLGPLQFVSAIRARMPALHRWSGRVFAAACAVAAPSGVMLALGTTAGPVAGAGFAVQAVLLPVFVLLGVRAATARRIEAHRAWMLRAYALIAGAITLRLMLPTSIFLGYDFLEAYRVIAWATWIVNLALAEYVIRRHRVSTGSFRALATV